MGGRSALDLEDGTQLDVTAVPLQSFDSLRVEMHPNGFVLHFLRSEKPHPVCLARFGIPKEGIVGIIVGLVEVARDAGISVPNVFGQDDDDTLHQTH